MKLKTYFGPKVVRVIAVSLFLIALAAAVLTAYDAMRPVSEQGAQENVPAGERAETKAKDTPQKQTPRISREEMTENIIEAIDKCREENPSWFVCKTDKECADVMGPCGSRDAVNRQFRTPAEICHRTTGASMRCDPFDRSPTRARCVEGVCVAQKQEPSAPKKP